MEGSEISRLLDTQTHTTINRFRERSRQPEAHLRFTQAFDDIVGLYAMEARSLPVTVVVEEPSTSGILPSGAKKEFVRSVLSGQQPPPLKVQEVEIPTTNEEKSVDSLAVHIVEIADPLAKSDGKSISNLVQVLESLKQHLGTGTLRIEPPNTYSQVPINVARVKVTLHLITKTATGSVSLSSLPLRTSADLEKCLKEYEKALVNTTSYDPEASPTQGQFADKVIGQKIAAAIKADEGPGKIVIPVIPNVREEEIYWGGRSGNTASNLEFDAMGKKNFLTLTSGEPEILHYPHSYTTQVSYSSQ